MLNMQLSNFWSNISSSHPCWFILFVFYWYFRGFWQKQQSTTTGISFTILNYRWEHHIILLELPEIAGNRRMSVQTFPEFWDILQQRKEGNTVDRLVAWKKRSPPPRRAAHLEINSPVLARARETPRGHEGAGEGPRDHRREGGPVRGLRLAKLAKFFQFVEIFWRARSRLYQNEIL